MIFFQNRFTSFEVKRLRNEGSNRIRAVGCHFSKEVDQSCKRPSKSGCFLVKYEVTQQTTKQKIRNGNFFVYISIFQPSCLAVAAEGKYLVNTC